MRSKRGVVLADVVRTLPRRTPLPRRSVWDSQRWRMLEAATEAVARRGYADASVADVIEIAGVSRRTFYEQFRDKEHCFLTAYDVLSDRLIEAMTTVGAAHPAGAARRRAQIEKFCAALAHEPLVARALMVDVLGAGARALAAREAVNARFALAVLGPDVAEFQRAAIVGAVNAVVIGKLLDRKAGELPVDDLCAFVEHALRR